MKIRIVVDECGKAPVRDAERPLVACALALPDKDVSIQSVDLHATAIMRSLLLRDLHPAVVFVRPVRGYETALREGHRLRESMAEMTRSISGRNKEFVSDRGMPLRNHVWSHCVSLAIFQAIVPLLFRTPIDGVDVFADQFSLTRTQRNLFEFIVSSLPQRVAEAVPPQMRLVRTGVVSPFHWDLSTPVSLKWVDKEEGELASALTVVDRLAYHAEKPLAKREITPLLAELDRPKNVCALFDATPILMGGPNPVAAREWLENTRRDLGLD